MGMFSSKKDRTRVMKTLIFLTVVFPFLLPFLPSILLPWFITLVIKPTFWKHRPYCLQQDVGYFNIPTIPKCRLHKCYHSLSQILSSKRGSFYTLKLVMLFKVLLVLKYSGRILHQSKGNHNPMWTSMRHWCKRSLKSMLSQLNIVNWQNMNLKTSKGTPQYSVCNTLKLQEKLVCLLISAYSLGSKGNRNS